MAETQTTLTRSNTLQLFPFKHVHAALAVTIAPTPHDPPVAQGHSIQYHKHFWERGIQPSLDIHVDVAKASDESGLTTREINAIAYLRNRAAKRYEVLARWPIDEVPRSWASEKAYRISAGAEIGVALILDKAKKPDADRAYRLGSVLESASVKIVAERPQITFPVRVVSPDEFVKYNLPADTLHTVSFKGNDFERPPADVLEIWVNSKYVDRLQALLSRPDGRSMGASMVASIFGSIARGVFANAKLPAKDEEGLLAKLHARFKAAHQIDDNELLLAAKEPQNLIIEAIAQSLAKVQKNI